MSDIVGTFSFAVAIGFVIALVVSVRIIPVTLYRRLGSWSESDNSSRRLDLPHLEPPSFLSDPFWPALSISPNLFVWDLIAGQKIHLQCACAWTDQ